MVDVPQHDAAWPPTRPHVHALALELTGFCNQTCDYCYNPFRADGGASVGSVQAATTLARLDRILESVDLDHVTLTGGEPLVSHDLFALLEGLRARRVSAQMISNGALVTEAVAQRLARYRLRSVLVTLNAPSAVLHDRLVGPEGQFARTLEGIAHLRRARVPVQGSIVVMRPNAAQVGDTLAQFRALGVMRVALSRFSPAGYGLAQVDSILPTHDDVRIALAHGAEAARAHGMTVFATMPIPQCVVDRTPFPEIDFHDCPIGTPAQEFALGVDGVVRHCALHREPIARDVLDRVVDVRQLFGANDPHGYRRTVPARCEPCTHRDSCGGGCGAAAYWATGDARSLDPWVDPRRRLTVLA